jgi:molybdate transport system regulatory protein
MNKLTGTITKIQQSGAILLVDIEVHKQNFSALMIESVVRPDWLVENQAVDVVFKETEVSLAKNFSGQISMRNRMKCSILEIERGELLSKVKLNFKNDSVTSAITTRSVDSLNLIVGDEIDAFVKANEISLMKRK